MQSQGQESTEDTLLIDLIEGEGHNSENSHSSGADHGDTVPTPTPQAETHGDHHKNLLFFLLSVVTQIVSIVLSILHAEADITDNTLIGKAYYVYRIMLFIFMTIFSAIGIYCSKNFESSQKTKPSPYTGFELLILFTSFGFYVCVFFSLFAGIATLKEYKGSEDDKDYFHMYSIYVIIMNISRFIQVYFQVMFMFQAISIISPDMKQKHPQQFYCYTQVMLFFIPFNFGFWFIDSFIDLKNAEVVGTIEADYYGSTTWEIIVHITYPMILFFRFNSFIHCTRTYLQIYYIRNI